MGIIGRVLLFYWWFRLWMTSCRSSLADAVVSIWICITIASLLSHPPPVLTLNLFKKFCWQGAWRWWRGRVCSDTKTKPPTEVCCWPPICAHLSCALARPRVGQRCWGSRGGCQSRSWGTGKGWIRCIQNSSRVCSEDPPAKRVKL